MSIGFPKEVDETTTNGINIRINESEICKLIRGFQNENCNNKMNNYEKNYSRDITKFDKSMVNPKNLNINILIFVMCILSGYLTMCKKE